jgi:plastocyanin
MRKLLIVIGGAALLTLLIAARPTTPPDAQAATTTVKVHVNCQGSRVSFWVDPWTVTIGQGDEVEWQLQGNATSNQISVEPKRGRQWPFNGNAQAGTKASPARSGGPANRVGRHGYNITLACDNNGPTVVVDPDIVIN